MCVSVTHYRHITLVALFFMSLNVFSHHNCRQIFLHQFHIHTILVTRMYSCQFRSFLSGVCVQFSWMRFAHSKTKQNQSIKPYIYMTQYNEWMNTTSNWIFGSQKWHFDWLNRKEQELFVSQPKYLWTENRNKVDSLRWPFRTSNTITFIYMWMLISPALRYEPHQSRLCLFSSLIWVISIEWNWWNSGAVCALL